MSGDLCPPSIKCPGGGHVDVDSLMSWPGGLLKPNFATVTTHADQPVVYNTYVVTVVFGVIVHC